MTSQLFCVNSMYSIIVIESSVTGVIANHLHIGELKSRAYDTHLRSYRQPVVKLRSESISSSAVMFWPHVLLTPWKSLLVIVVKPESCLIFQINVVVIILHSSKADRPWKAGIYVSFVMLNEAMQPRGPRITWPQGPYCSGWSELPQWYLGLSCYHWPCLSLQSKDVAGCKK